MTHSEQNHSHVAEFVSNLHLQPRQFHKNLTLWPLARDGSSGPTSASRFMSLAEALEAGTLVLDEVSDSGDVPHVRAHNHGEEAVLVLFGEEIEGALQNRVANASFLVPAGSDVVIDVSCVERGRWSRPGGQRFRHGGHVSSAALRRVMAGRVAESRRRGLRFQADQGEVWAEVEDRLEASGTHSPSDAYADYVASRSSDMGELAKAFHPVPGQVGFVAAIGDEVVGVECVGEPDLFARCFPHLLRSYTIDAVDHAFLRSRRGEAPPPSFDAPEEFLAAVAEAPFHTGPSLGAGQDVRIEGERVAGCALADDGIVHLMAFPQRRPVAPGEGILDGETLGDAFAAELESQRLEGDDFRGEELETDGSFGQEAELEVDDQAPATGSRQRG